MGQLACSQREESCHEVGLEEKAGDVLLLCGPCLYSSSPQENCPMETLRTLWGVRRK